MLRLIGVVLPVDAAVPPSCRADTGDNAPLTVVARVPPLAPTIVMPLYAAESPERVRVAFCERVRPRSAQRKDPRRGLPQRWS